MTLTPPPFIFGTPLLVTRLKNPAAPLSHNAAV
jgi:hypothetical protein